MRVFLLGDTHGDTDDALAHANLAHSRGCDVILQLGDFGFMGRGVDQFIWKLNQALIRHDLEWWWVDGNHENHERLAQFPLDDTGLRPIAFQDGMTPKIFHIPRGHRWEWDGIKFLGCGGAYSVDKQWRKEGVSWWPQERITEADIIRCGVDPVDVLVSHDVPWGVLDPYGPRTGGGDKDLWPESTANRYALRAIVDAVRPKLVVHGHTHHRKSTDMLLEDGTHVQVEGFSCNGGEGHWGIIDLEQLKGNPSDGH